MKVQHPSKTQFDIVPTDNDGRVEEVITTDERGVVEVTQKLGKQLVKQGWTEIEETGGKSAKEG